MFLFCCEVKEKHKNGIQSSTHSGLSGKNVLHMQIKL